LIVYGSGGSEKIGVAVNSVIGLQEILIKPLDATLKCIKGFGGVTMLGNGTVVLVLDVCPLIAREMERERTHGFFDGKPAQFLVS